MPRKTDGIEFELHPGPQKDKDGKPLLYAKLASKKKLTFEQLESYSISHQHMAKGELEACFTKFLNCAALCFHEGYRVETPIGSFAPKQKLTREHTDPRTVTGRDIMYGGVDFIPTNNAKGTGTRVIMVIVMIESGTKTTNYSGNRRNRQRNPKKTIYTTDGMGL